MTDDACAEMRLLIQADADGELAPTEAARVGAHLDRCDDCADVQARLMALSDRLRQGLPYHAASAGLQARIAAAVAQRAPAPRPSLGLRAMVTFAGGSALAACLVLLLAAPRGAGLADRVVEDHIRALQPGHLMDVASTDQHTVKPWFDGRLDFAPPVKDLAPVGFPLAGGRTDYLAGRSVAALVYQRRQHAIDLFVWPDGGQSGGGPDEGGRNGYNFVRWDQDGMAFWAVSDLDTRELADFVRLWQAG